MASAVLALAACQRDPAPPAAKAAPSASAIAAASAPPSPSFLVTPGASSALVAAKSRPSDAAQRVLMEWNAALDRHSLEALTPLYAPSVDFYGQRRTAEQVLDAKRQAFEKLPGFRQRVSGVSVGKEGGGFRLRFEKRSGSELKDRATGVLVVKPLAGKWLITEESDAMADARFKPQAGSCPEAASGIASSEPAILADRARVSREHPYVTAGGLQYDLEDRSDRYSGSQGYFHEDHYEPRWWIDAADGQITIRDAYTGELLPVTPAQRALVQKVCTGKAEGGDAAP